MGHSRLCEMYDARSAQKVRAARRSDIVPDGVRRPQHNHIRSGWPTGANLSGYSAIQSRTCSAQMPAPYCVRPTSWARESGSDRSGRREGDPDQGIEGRWDEDIVDQALEAGSPRSPSATRRPAGRFPAGSTTATAAAPTRTGRRRLVTTSWARPPRAGSRPPAVAVTPPSEPSLDGGEPEDGRTPQGNRPSQGVRWARTIRAATAVVPAAVDGVPRLVDSGA